MLFDAQIALFGKLRPRCHCVFLRMPKFIWYCIQVSSIPSRIKNFSNVPLLFAFHAILA